MLSIEQMKELKVAVNSRLKDMGATNPAEALSSSLYWEYLNLATLLKMASVKGSVNNVPVELRKELTRQFCSGDLYDFVGLSVPTTLNTDSSGSIDDGMSRLPYNPIYYGELCTNWKLDSSYARIRDMLYYAGYTFGEKSTVPLPPYMFNDTKPMKGYTSLCNLYRDLYVYFGQLGINLDNSAGLSNLYAWLQNNTTMYRDDGTLINYRITDLCKLCHTPSIITLPTLKAGCIVAPVECLSFEEACTHLNSTHVFANHCKALLTLCSMAVNRSKVDTFVYMSENIELVDEERPVYDALVDYLPRPEAVQNRSKEEFCRDLCERYNLSSNWVDSTLKSLSTIAEEVANNWG